MRVVQGVETKPTAIRGIEVCELGTESCSETLALVSIQGVPYGIPLYVKATYSSCTGNDQLTDGLILGHGSTSCSYPLSVPNKLAF